MQEPLMRRRKTVDPEVMNNYPDRLRKGAFWVRGYFVSTVREARLVDQIRAYVRKPGPLAPLELLRQSDPLRLF